jgi:hypothetical protein
VLRFAQIVKPGRSLPLNRARPPSPRGGSFAALARAADRRACHPDRDRGGGRRH